MGSTYPSSLDNFAESSPTNLGDSDTTGRTHAERHDDVEAAVEQIEETLGTLPQGSDSTVRDRIASAESDAASALSAFNTHTHGSTPPALAASGGALTGALELPDGSAGAPSLTNSGDTNTGVFFPAADTVGIATGGTERVRVDSSVGVHIKGPDDSGTQTTIGLGITPGVSAATQPAVALYGEEFDTSDYRGSLVIATRNTNSDVAPTERMRVTNSGLVVIGNGVANAAPATGEIRGTGGSGTDIAGADFLLSAGQGTGAGAGGALSFRTAPAGASGTTLGTLTERMRIDSAGVVTAPTWYSATTASAANVFVTSGGALQRSTSSLKYKTDVQDATEAEQDAVIAGLRPVTYRSLSDADDPAARWWGFIAEEVEEVDPRLVTHGEGGSPEGVQYDRIIPALVGVIQRLEARVAELESRLA